MGKEQKRFTAIYLKYIGKTVQEMSWYERSGYRVALSKDLEPKWLGIRKKYNFRCARCGIKEGTMISNVHYCSWAKVDWMFISTKPIVSLKLTRDHICPVTHESFNESWKNIQPLCLYCNSTKNNRTFKYRIKNRFFRQRATPRLIELLLDK